MDIEKKIDDLLGASESTEESGSPPADSPGRKVPGIKILLFVSAAAIIAGAIFGIYYYAFVPRSKITFPEKATPVQSVFEVRGFTKNIPSERKYLWICVDVENLGLCWPKRRVFKINDHFNTKIAEFGPKGKFTVSLCAVDRDIHEDIQNWFRTEVDTGNHAGFSMIPGIYRIDSLRLIHGAI